MVTRGHLRASDGDREQVAERLRQAAAEGRLLEEELEGRLAHALRARTYAELDPLVADLPGGRPVARRRRNVSPVATVAVTAVVAVVVLAVIALAVMVITGLAAAWAMWALVAWWLFGRRRHGCARRQSRTELRLANRRGAL